jgi:dethiobiotin synthetase
MQLFVTGTDTGCGKTLVTLGLMEKLRRNGTRVAGMKPVAAGAEQTLEGLRNEDALAIQALCHRPYPYSLVNPVCLQAPAAPHLAAAAEGQSIGLDAILESARTLRADSDHLIVEGAGGWRVPLTESEDMAELCRRLELPAVLVVGLKLGCLNHALLSVESILASGVTLAGWVANSLQPTMPFEAENIATLEARIPAPLLGHLPWQARPDPGFAASRLRLPPLA